MTMLSAAKDPGEKVVFLGYFTLVGGMLVVLATRIGDRRRAARLAATAAGALLALARSRARPPRSQRPGARSRPGRSRCGGCRCSTTGA